jgi:hypothetical protein
MDKPELQLRLFQGGCILFLLACILLLHFGVLGSLEPAGREMNLTQFLMIGGAIWSAAVGFTFQRRVTRAATRPQRPSARSTPFIRWRAGHVMRLGSATSVGIWGLALYYFHSPLWVVNTILAVGLILLVTWRPSASPDTKSIAKP